MATLFIDGKPYQADERRNLLEACLQLGFDLPYFCWHPAMGSVGACRQCAVKTFKDESDDEGTIVMACMTAVTDGLRISIDDPEARAFREEVVGWLMVNHPHDCPVCDEGGECHLQDMTVMTGHAYRRYRFDKRTHVNQDLGPFIHHEMNRCIQCYRCVRFYRDVAGGRDLNVFGAHDHVYFGRESDGTLESEFAGNLVEVCPTGVFTDKTLRRHYTRKWDMQMAPSVCVHCGVGCNTSAGERYGSLRRILNRYNHEVNGYFLCDRGRFGYEFVNDDDRLRRPQVRGQQTLDVVDAASAAHRTAQLLARCDRVIGISSARASLESNFALRELVGPDNFFAGVPARQHRLRAKVLDILRRGTAPAASVEDVARSDAVLVLGENLLDTAPRVALALREAVKIRPMHRVDALGIPRWSDAAVRDTIQDEKGPLYVATPDATRFDDLAAESLRGAPADIARLGFAVAHAIESPAPAVTDLEEDRARLATAIAASLVDAEHPLVIAGTSLGSEAVIEAAANVAWALRRRGKHARILLVLPECNSLGAAMLGGGSLEDAFAAAETEALGVVVVETDLYRHAPGRRVDAFLEACRAVVVVDHVQHATARRADALLPAATFAEGSGTLVSAEGRAQRFFKVVDVDGPVRDSWRWLRDLEQTRADAALHGWRRLDDVISAIAAAEPALAGIADAAPDASTRLVGQLVPRQRARYSGRTAMLANRTVHEPPPPADPDSPLSMSMEGFRGQPPAALLPTVWSPGWNSVQAVNTFQEEIAGALRGGAAGVRLIEPHLGDAPYFSAVPAPAAATDGSWTLVPVHHVFGSEELSALAPGIRARMPAATLSINPDDARRLGLDEGDPAMVAAGETRLRLPVRLRPAMPRGIVGVPVGLPGVPWLDLPTAATVAGEGS